MLPPTSVTFFPTLLTSSYYLIPCFLLSPAKYCSLPLLPAHSCYLLLLPAHSCSLLLLLLAHSCSLLLPTSPSCPSYIRLLHPYASYVLLLHPTSSCSFLLPLLPLLLQISSAPNFSLLPLMSLLHPVYFLLIPHASLLFPCSSSLLLPTAPSCPSDPPAPFYSISDTCTPSCFILLCPAHSSPPFQSLLHILILLPSPSSSLILYCPLLFPNNSPLYTERRKCVQ